MAGPLIPGGLLLKRTPRLRAVGALTLLATPGHKRLVFTDPDLHRLLSLGSLEAKVHLVIREVLTVEGANLDEVVLPCPRIDKVT